MCVPVFNISMHIYTEEHVKTRSGKTNALSKRQLSWIMRNVTAKREVEYT